MNPVAIELFSYNSASVGNYYCKARSGFKETFLIVSFRSQEPLRAVLVVITDNCEAF